MSIKIYRNMENFEINLKGVMINDVNLEKAGMIGVSFKDSNLTKA